jgi:hypothetical protein
MPYVTAFSRCIYIVLASLGYSLVTPYYNWRSFIGHGRYDWDSAIVDEIHFANISDAMSYVNYPYNGWPSESGMPGYIDVYPMTTLNKSVSPQDAMLFWGANRIHGNSEAVDKVLLSPSWGDAWFPEIYYSEVKGIGYNQCAEEDLRTLIQNEMFAPTDLTRKLFDGRRGRILNTTDKSPTYGAIHVRTEFLRGERNASTEDIAESLAGCINAFPEVPVWWVITDEIETLLKITSFHLATSVSSKIVHGYKDKEFGSMLTSGHSNTAAFSLFNQASMAPAILDWMVLHESSLALVGPGAYGESGARGNGKIPAGTCGDLNSRGQLQVFTPRQAKSGGPMRRKRPRQAKPGGTMRRKRQFHGPVKHRGIARRTKPANSA